MAPSERKPKRDPSDAERPTATPPRPLQAPARPAPTFATPLTRLPIQAAVPASRTPTHPSLSAVRAPGQAEPTRSGVGPAPTRTPGQSEPTRSGVGPAPTRTPAQGGAVARPPSRPSVPSARPLTQSSFPTVRTSAPSQPPPRDGNRASAAHLPAVRGFQESHSGEVTISSTTALKPEVTQVQRRLSSSDFVAPTALDAKRALVMGEGRPSKTDQPVQQASETFDGETAPSVLQERDVWKAVAAPVQSRENNRKRALLQQVLAQFAVGTNPRYEADSPSRPRAHVFVWDVSRAMGCEIPHFLGAKELSLGHTVDWLRLEGPMHGWKHTDEDDAFARANAGQLALVLPKDVRAKAMGIVMPGRPTPDGDLPLCGAMLRRGYRLAPQQLLGVRHLELFWHP